MKLADALDQVYEMPEDAVILARRPWTSTTDAAICHLDNCFRIPKALADEGLEYFLEATVAKEVLEVLASRESTPENRRTLLIYYAENDAFPNWVYEQ